MASLLPPLVSFSLAFSYGSTAWPFQRGSILHFIFLFFILMYITVYGTLLPSTLDLVPACCTTKGGRYFACTYTLYYDLLLTEESFAGRSFDLHRFDIILRLPHSASCASVLPHVHIRTARVVFVLACTKYSSLFDSYILVQVERENNCFFPTFYSHHSNGFKPVAILPIGTYVANINHILNLSYMIWCPASLANHGRIS